MNPLNLLSGISLKVWLYVALAAALLIGYGYWHHHVYAQGAASVQVKLDALTAKYTAAQVKASADHDALQAKIDGMAQPDNAALSAQFTALQKKLDELKAHDIAYKPARPLPAGCQLDPARVEAANQALAQ
jgi:hypothetical protein